MKGVFFDDGSTWNFISLSLLWSVWRGNLLFKFNYRGYGTLRLNDHIPKFYRDITMYWKEISGKTKKKRD